MQASQALSTLLLLRQNAKQNAHAKATGAQKLNDFLLPGKEEPPLQQISEKPENIASGRPL